MLDLPAEALLLPRGCRALVALSGGTDSLALLHLLAGHRSAMEWGLWACHVHHGQRAEAADDDVRFLRQVCAGLGVPLEVRRVDVPALARRRRLSLEAAGREARLTALGDAATELGCELVVTGHHADDQLETILLQGMRGTGLAGIVGMRAARQLSPIHPGVVLVRPLLSTTRAELAEYCAHHRLLPRHDVTNDDPFTLRRRVRSRIAPHLRSSAPEILAEIRQLSDEAASALAQLDLATAATLAGLEGRSIPGLKAVELPPADLEPGALARLCRALLIPLCPGTAPDRAVVARLAESMRGVRRPFSLPGGRWRAEVDDLVLWFRAVHSEASPPPIQPNAHGDCRLENVGLTLSFQPAAESERRDALTVRTAKPESLHLRHPLPGDRIRSGGARPRLVSDLFQESRVPPPLRSVWPVLVDADGPLCVVGLAAATPGDAHAAEVVIRLDDASAPGIQAWVDRLRDRKREATGTPARRSADSPDSASPAGPSQSRP